MKSRAIKNIFLTTLTSLAIGLLGLAFSALKAPVTTYAEGESVIDTVSAQMEYGASVRMPSAGSSYDQIGIRFSMTMSDADYSKLKQETGEDKTYSETAFGIFVAPKSYYDIHKIDDETSLTTYYYWNAQDETADKARILNLESETLNKSALTETRRFDGAVVNMLADNLLKEYIGIGYIRYVENGETHYKFAEQNDNVRSMVYVAQHAIEAGEDTNGLLDEYYLTAAITDTETTYVCEYYLQNGDEYVKSDADSYKLTANVNATVEETPKEISGYAFDETNQNNILSSRVYANGKTVLKLYYERRKPFEYNNSLTADMVTFTDNNLAGGSSQIVTEAMGKTGEFIMIDFAGSESTVSSGTNANVYVAPAKAKSYYEKYAANGTYLTFEFYIDVTDAGFNNVDICGNCIRFNENLKNNAYVGTTKCDGYRTQMKGNTWLQAKILLTDIVNNYDDIKAGKLFIAGFESYTTGNELSDLSIYVGNFSIDFNLTDVTAETGTVTVEAHKDFDALTLLTTNKTYAEQYPDDLIVTLTDGAGVKTTFARYVDLSAFSGLNSVSIKIGATELFKGAVIISDTGSTDIVWNTVGENVIEAGYTDTWINGGGNSFSCSVTTLSSENAIGDKTSGMYYHLRAKDIHAAQNARFTLKPLFEKAAYEAYLEDNPNAKLVFEVYLSPEGEFTHQNRLYQINGQSGNKQFEVNKWNTLEISLATLINNWDNLSTQSNETSNFIFGWIGSYNGETNPINCYIGDFHIESGASA